MKLYLLRHGIAEQRMTVSGRADADRPLTPDGAKRMRRIAGKMEERGLSFDCILTSPFRRARQTARIVANVLELKKEPLTTPHLEPGGNLNALVDELRANYASMQHLLLVGHEPSLTTLISILVGGQSDLLITMKKGGLCRLSVDALQFGRCATLDWLLPPSQILVE